MGGEQIRTFCIGVEIKVGTNEGDDMRREGSQNKSGDVLHATARVTDEEKDDELQTLTSEIPGLQDEVNTLTKTLAEVTVEEGEVFKQLRSLKYALQLTRGELERRHRANSELHTAYRTSSDGLQLEGDRRVEQTTTGLLEGINPSGYGRGGSDESSAAEATAGLEQEEVQRLETELLNAKRDSASVTFEVETLEFQLKRLRESLHDAREEAAKQYEVVSSPGGLASKSPALPVRSGSRPGSVRSPPTARASRLIGDVDALIGFANDEGIPDGQYAPCRLGVSANGHIGVYSYASPESLMTIDGLDNPISELCTEDALALADGLEAVRVGAGDRSYVLCGLSEALRAATQLMTN